MNTLEIKGLLLCYKLPGGNILDFDEGSLTCEDKIVVVWGNVIE